MYRGSAADVLAGVFCKPGNPTAKKGDYIHLVDFLRLRSMQKVVLFGCPSRGLGGLLSKTAVSEAISSSRAVHTC